MDASVLLYAHSATSPHHGKASQWIERALLRHEDIGLAWVTITAFLRLSTNSAAYERPLAMREAVAILEGYLSRSHVYAVSPGAEHWALFTRVCDQAQITSRLITDAHLATLALELGAVLCSSDRDFTRFPGLRIINPLAEG